MKKSKKLIAVLLIAVMAASLLSTAAFADGPESYCVGGNMLGHMKQWAGVARDLFEKGVKGFLDIIRPQPAPAYEAAEVCSHMGEWAGVAARLAQWGIETFYRLTHPIG